jgi:hypothetical protein
LISWKQATSGCADSSHARTVGRRALTEFTFQVAIRMGPTLMRVAVRVKRFQPDVKRPASLVGTRA